MSKIEEMSLEYANKQLKDAGVIDSNCPRELAIAQASMMVNGYKAGANWQEKQDQETIELAEDHAMLAGMNKMKEQIMAKAVDVEVKVDAGGYPYIPQIELYDYDKEVPLAKEGDKYKVVLIKK